MKEQVQFQSKIFRCTDIKYDTEEDVDLPKTIDVEVYFDPNDPEMDLTTLNSCIEDWLSDRITELTGFCHKGFQFTEIENENRS